MALAACLLAGCEDDGIKATDEFRVSPSEVTMPVDQFTAVLTVEGGIRPYDWSVSDTSLGTLTGAEGDADQQVTYTRTDKNGRQVVTVQDSQGWFASAIIDQITATPTSETALAISPSQVTVASTNGSVVLTAIGGQGTYEWGLVAPQPNGAISQYTGPMTIYTSTNSTTDQIWLTDGEGTVTATIYKQ